MTATQARIGYGSTFEISTDSGSTWTAVAEVMNITPPSDAVDVIDATHMASPNRTREFIAGLNDPGEASFEMNFIPGGAGDQAIQALRGTYATIQCRITYPNGQRWTFAGILTGYEPTDPMDDKMTATVTFKVTASYSVSSASAPANTTLPAIAGVAQVGVALTALEGVWTNAPTSFAYQWQADTAGNGTFANIAGATSRTYTPVAGDQGDAIRVQVTATNSAGSSSAANSAPTQLTLAA